MNKFLTVNSNKKFSTGDLVKLSLFSSIIFVLGSTPFGFIPIGAFKIVTIHIPVIIGSIILGARKGAILGFIFGLTSFIMSSLQPTTMSYFFTPFLSGNLLSLVVCFVPRILVGVLPAIIFNFCRKFINLNVSLILTGLLGSLVNTFFVITFICVFFGQKYAEKLGTTIDNLGKVIIATVGFNAIIEALCASIFVLAIGKVLFRKKY